MPVLPQQPDVSRTFLRNAMVLKDCSSAALFVPTAIESLGEHAVHVYYDSYALVICRCAVIVSLGLTMQFHGTI